MNKPQNFMNFVFSEIKDLKNIFAAKCIYLINYIYGDKCEI